MCGVAIGHGVAVRKLLMLQTSMLRPSLLQVRLLPVRRCIAFSAAS
jgi:hypothetical protein